MIRGCLAQLISIAIVGALLLWFFRHPESIANLIGSGLGLVASGGDALGRFANALVPAVDGLF